MLNRFTPDDIVQEKFKLPSFNHVLLQRKDTKIYQVIFLSSLIYAPIYIHLPALASPIKPLSKSSHTIWCERSHHLIRALTPFDVSPHIKWCEMTFSAFRKDFQWQLKITWYKMLNRFAPDGIVPEEFKLLSFNHVLLQRKDTKMYQVIFLSSLNHVNGEGRSSESNLHQVWGYLWVGQCDVLSFFSELCRLFFNVSND